jgi:hypothetical protein
VGLDGGEQMGLSYQTVTPTPIGFWREQASQLAPAHAVLLRFCKPKVEYQNHGNDDTST